MPITIQTATNRQVSIIIQTSTNKQVPITIETHTHQQLSKCRLQSLVKELARANYNSNFNEPASANYNWNAQYSSTNQQVQIQLKRAIITHSTTNHQLIRTHTHQRIGKCQLQLPSPYLPACLRRRDLSLNTFACKRWCKLFDISGSKMSLRNEDFRSCLDEIQETDFSQALTFDNTSWN